MDVCGLGRLEKSNSTYLAKTTQRSVVTFGVLTGIKMGLSIIEGSEIGVGVRLQAGDAVQAAYDYVDIAWRTVLYSSIILTGLQFLLEAADYIDHWFLLAALVLLLTASAVQLFSTRRPRILLFMKNVAQLCILLSAMLFFVLPLSVTGGRILSRHITGPSVAKAETGIAGIRASAFPDKGAQTGAGFLSNLASVKDQINKISSFFGAKYHELSTLLTRIIAGYIFDCLVFPFLIFLFLFWLTRLAGYYLFGLQHAHTIKRELSGMLGSLFPGRNQDRPQ